MINKLLDALAVYMMRRELRKPQELARSFDTAGNIVW